ncbi:MAG: hypothetical protein WDM96_16280 [Lacunisphaera sp.]
MPPQSLDRRWLAILLLVCALMRIGLVLRGGEHFFWDEWRYDRGLELYRAWRAGDLPAARTVLADPAHFAFTPVSALLVALQHLGAQATGWADWSRGENILASRPLATGWLALASVLNIALAYGIARHATGDTATARWVALLMAGANTGFYYARHFLPYDLALSSALAAVLVGSGGRRSLRAGLFAGLAYHLYNGFLVSAPGLVPPPWLGCHCGPGWAAAPFGPIRRRRRAGAGDSRAGRTGDERRAFLAKHGRLQPDGASGRFSRGLESPLGIPVALGNRLRPRRGARGAFRPDARAPPARAR